MSPPLDRADTAATLKAPVLTVSRECAFDDLTWWRSICANKLRRRERRFLEVEVLETSPLVQRPNNQVILDQLFSVQARAAAG